MSLRLWFQPSYMLNRKIDITRRYHIKMVPSKETGVNRWAIASKAAKIWAVLLISSLPRVTGNFFQ